MMRKVMGSMFAGLILAGLASSAWAAVPAEMTYQGRLKESGALVNGVRSVEVFLCDAITGGSDGVNNFSASGPQSVTVTEGVFKTTFTLHGAVQLQVAPYWLEVRIGGTPLSPREPLTTIPYAFIAESANSLEPGNLSSGVLGTGVSLPAAQLSGGILPSGVQVPVLSLQPGTLGTGVLLPAAQVSAGILATSLLGGVPPSLLTAGDIGPGVQVPAGQLTAGMLSSGVLIDAGSLTTGILGSGVKLSAQMGVYGSGLNSGNLSGSGCGTGASINGNDSLGRLTIGTTPTGSICTLTFGTSWSGVAPFCFVNPGALATGVIAGNVNAVQVDFVYAGLNGTTMVQSSSFDYFCIGK